MGSRVLDNALLGGGGVVGAGADVVGALVGTGVVGVAGLGVSVGAIGEEVVGAIVGVPGGTEQQAGAKF